MTNKIDNKIAELNEELRQLHEQKCQLAEMNVNEQLAIELHSILCHSNHTDGCDWHYEISDGIHEWERASHARYLVKANKLILFARAKKIQIEDLIKTYKMIREM